MNKTFRLMLLSTLVFVLSGLSCQSEKPSLSTLGDDDWILRHWDFDEPAPEKPEVTLKYEEGKLSGTAGCNNYFTSIEESEIPGKLTIGPVGATRKMCPEPEMEVEFRFLKLLESVSEYQFKDGQLVLNYMIDDDSTPIVGSMHFGKR